jgi:hypothetical protein
VVTRAGKGEADEQRAEGHVLIMGATKPHTGAEMHQSGEICHK